MPMLEDAKKIAEKVTGGVRPSRANLSALVRERKASTFHFKDDGMTPNHPKWPLVIYRGAVCLPKNLYPAAHSKNCSKATGGAISGVTAFTIMCNHSRIHEVLGVARGEGKVQFGGHLGRTLKMKAGDAAILPAGTGHQCLSASKDFLAIGAYPPSGKYDECTSSEDHEAGPQRHSKSGRPRKDPVYGTKGTASQSLAIDAVKTAIELSLQEFLSLRFLFVDQPLQEPEILFVAVRCEVQRPGKYGPASLLQSAFHAFS